MNRCWRCVLILGLLWNGAACRRPIADAPNAAATAPAEELPPPPADNTEPVASIAASAPSETPPAQSAKPKTVAIPPLQDPIAFLSPERVEDGWISLFDGQTLFGWTATEGLDWSVQDGALTAGEGPEGWLLTTLPFANFELLCEYQLSEGGNSGVFFRSEAPPTKPGEDCYEVNIADSHPEGYLTGSLVGQAQADRPIQGSGGWRSLRIKVDGPHIEVDCDGEPALKFEDTNPKAPRVGRIGLQKRAGAIAFRQVWLRPLGLTCLFDGKSLAGWRASPGSLSEFTIEDETIRVKNGAGFLESEQVFDDFIFQIEAKTNAADLNSGFFFRAEPSTEAAPSNGYEVQIHNGVKDGDLNKPANAGTGAIFRRVDARRVVARDGEWFSTTLVAAGPRFGVWVNGLMVVDWEDQRAPHDNPRQGQRLAAGHLSLQGHDPTTDVQFRAAKIQPLPSPRE